MRRTLTALAIAFAVLPAPAPSARATQAVPIVVIDGRGFGHGVGMAQEGAFWMGAAGATTEQILGQFYPGTSFGRASGPVRIPVLDAGPAPASGLLAFPDGGEIREGGSGPGSAGFPVRVAPGGQVRLILEGGRSRVEGGTPTGATAATANASAGTVAPALGRSTRPQIPTVTSSTTTTAPPTEEPPPESTTTTTSTTPRPLPPPTSPTTAPPEPEPEPAPEPQPRPDPGDPAPPPPPPASPDPTSARPLVAVPAGGGSVAVVSRGRRYRGVIEAIGTTGTLRFVNTVDLEDYLKGMGEVRDPRWPPAALRAQAIAARTYAMRAMATGGEVCDTQRCQVYLGSQAEYGAMNRAVDDSRARVLVFGRALISAVYSANGGGFSASREEGFGVVDDSIPYLRAAPYLTKDPGPWTVTVALQDVAARLGYPGTVTDVRISRLGPSQRALEVTLDGSAGPRAVTGLAFDASLGLRSTLFTVRIEAGEAPPPPPPADGSELQAPPEEAAAVAAAETATKEEASAPTTTAPSVASPADGRRSFDTVDPSTRRRQQVLVVSAWLATALVGAAGFGISEGRARWRPTRRPSPSAPRTEDGSP